MLAKDNVKYAIVENGFVTMIFDSDMIKEWDESVIHAVEIPEARTDIKVGSRYDNISKSFLEKGLEELKSESIATINLIFESEVEALKGNVSKSEIDTWVSQLREAKEFLTNPKANTPLLDNLSKERNTDKKTLSNKIIEKNNVYHEKVGKLVGYRQALEKAIKAVSTKEELDKIEYKSPLIDTI